MAADPHRHRRWSNLPVEILQLFTDHLTAVADINRFGAVCKSWRSVAAEARFLRRPRNKVPFLLLSGVGYDHSETWELFSLLDRKTHRSISVPGGTTCVGSSEGWLILLHQSSKEMYLLNPITGVRIPLPQIMESKAETADPSPNIIIKAIIILSSAPPNPDKMGDDGCYVVTVFRRNRLAWCSPGDKKWTFFLKGHVKRAVDIIFHQGILHVTDGRNIEAYGMGKWGPWPIGPRWLPLPGFIRARTDTADHHLVTCGGALLLVRREQRPPVSDHPSDSTDYTKALLPTVGLKVWQRIDQVNWVLLEDLEDQALYLAGNICAAAVVEEQGSDHLTFGRNCIYFTGICGNPSFDHPSGETQLLCYCYRDKIIQRCRISMSQVSKHQPVWFLPDA